MSHARRVLAGQEFVVTSFWCKVVAVSVYAVVVVGKAALGSAAKQV
jgi:hypothetical protein